MEDALYAWINHIRDIVIETGERPTKVESDMGSHDVTFSSDETGEFFTISFELPLGCYGVVRTARADDEVIGDLEGIRVYLPVELPALPKQAAS